MPLPKRLRAGSEGIACLIANSMTNVDFVKELKLRIVLDFFQGEGQN